MGDAVSLARAKPLFLEWIRIAIAKPLFFIFFPLSFDSVQG
jgi:hypothetical protein